jgi:hypothetical protein
MDFLVGGLSSIISVVSFVLFAAGVMKVFQMATTLSEIKDALTAIKLNAPIHPAIGPAVGSVIGSPVSAPAALPSTPSGEEMLRAALSELDHPVNPTSIELGNKS